MDYKELIEKLERTIYYVGDSVNRYCDGADEILESAVVAIKTLLAERNEAIKMLHGKCSACKYSNVWSDEEPCCSCIYKFKEGKNNNWEWIGIEQCKKEEGE